MPDCVSPIHAKTMSKKHHMSESDLPPRIRDAEKLHKTLSTKSLPTLKEAKVDQPSLAEFLKKKSRVSAFRDFLKKEFSDENLDFWVEVETYKKLKSKKQIKVATDIFKTFIDVGSEREVNIDATTRKVTANNLAEPNKFTFDLAQSTIFVLMERDSFPRFVITQLTAGLGSKLFSKPSREQKDNNHNNKQLQKLHSDAKKATIFAASVGLVLHGRTFERQIVKLG